MRSLTFTSTFTMIPHFLSLFRYRARLCPSPAIASAEPHEWDAGWRLFRPMSSAAQRAHRIRRASATRLGMASHWGGPAQRATRRIPRRTPRRAARAVWWVGDLEVSVNIDDVLKAKFTRESVRPAQ